MSGRTEGVEAPAKVCVTLPMPLVSRQLVVVAATISVNLGVQ